MSLHAPGPRRERILVYAQAGGGKSFVWLSIAEWIYKTHSTAKIWLTDSDMGWDAMRPTDGHLDSIVIASLIHEFDDYRQAAIEVRKNAGPDDWFAFDVVSKVWDETKQEFIREKFEKEPDLFYLEDNDLLGGDYGRNWPVMRSMYAATGIGMIPRLRCHVLACAYANKVKVPDEGKRRGPLHDSLELELKYGRIGWKPDGEDKIAHLFHTELYMADTPSGYKMSTAKDRQRDKIMGANVSPDFVVAYLMRQAGWKP